MITMSIQIVPVIDNYITQFMGLDKSIPRIFTETKTLIFEYYKKNYKVSKYKRTFMIIVKYSKANLWKKT